MDSVDIAQNINDGTTSITFKGNDKYSYIVYTRPKSSITTVTVLKPAKPGEKLIVIDAGHGGSDPGAVYKNLKEKDLNVDIARRLNALLKQKNINTYMIREDDCYVALYERTYIANALNASLFLSIHNNAMDNNTSYSGTMTLYYPQRSNSTKFNGKDFASIIQKSMLSKLKTIDRKIIERPNLVVLKATKMPAALAEVAFITNKSNRTELQKASFRQNAAQALCDAVVKSMELVK